MAEIQISRPGYLGLCHGKTVFYVDFRAILCSLLLVGGACLFSNFREFSHLNFLNFCVVVVLRFRPNRVARVFARVFKVRESARVSLGVNSYIYIYIYIYAPNSSVLCSKHGRLWLYSNDVFDAFKTWKFSSCVRSHASLVYLYNFWLILYLVVRRR